MYSNTFQMPPKSQPQILSYFIMGVLFWDKLPPWLLHFCWSMGYLLKHTGAPKYMIGGQHPSHLLESGLIQVPTPICTPNVTSKGTLKNPLMHLTSHAKLLSSAVCDITIIQNIPLIWSGKLHWVFLRVLKHLMNIFEGICYKWLLASNLSSDGRVRSNLFGSMWLCISIHQSLFPYG